MVADAVMAAAKRARVGDDAVAVPLARRGAGAASDSDESDEGDEGDEGAGGRAPASAEEVAEALKLPVSHEVSLGGHKKTVTTVAVDGSGARVVTGSADCTVRLYDFGAMDTSYRAFRDLVPADGQPVQAVAWAPGGERFLAATTAAKLHIFDREGGRLRTTVKGDQYISDVGNTRGHVAGVSAAMWHPVDRDYVLSASLDGTLRFWNLNGRLQFDELVCGDVIRVKSTRGGKVGVTAAAVLPTGRALLAGTDEGALVLFNVKAAGSRYLRPDATIAAAHAPGATAVTAIALAPDGVRVATRGGDGLVRLWDLRKFGEGAAALATLSDLPTLHQTANLAWSPDGSLLLGGVDSGRAGGAGAGPGGRVLAFKVAEVEAAAGAAAGGVHAAGVPASSAAAYTASLCDAPVVALAWHAGINQVAAGCGDGATRVLYNPRLSVKGALLGAKRMPKKRDMSDAVPTAFVGTILNPHALPLFRPGGGGAGGGGAGGGAGRKRRLTELAAVERPGGAAAAAAAATAAAALPGRPTAPTAVEPDFLTDHSRTFTQHFVRQHLVPDTVNLREQDPTEVLRAYAAKAATAPEAVAMRAAYATTQPRTLLAETTMEEEEAAARSERDAFLRRNVAGKS